MPAGILDTVILIALPASGKSEVRTYLDALNPEVREEEMHIAPNVVPIDDFEYVWDMRRIDDELVEVGAPRIFFQTPQKPFKDPRDWGTLVHLVNEDWWNLQARRICNVADAVRILFERIDVARLRAGITPALYNLDRSFNVLIANAIEEHVRKKLEQRNAFAKDGLTDKTLIIEFARGGPVDATFPLPAPLGYAHSLALLDPAILAHAVVLYVWVTPEESRRRNEERRDPKNPGSILGHSVPRDVMLNDYGCDDIGHLLDASDRPNTIRVESGEEIFYLPTARFDNRTDKTLFVRRSRETWTGDEISALHAELKTAFATLYAAR
ncbi:hypothetical protein HY625_03380 [Candidatus Uhrbacteria bacterium]|nr:hypothetical protein [Candidatus Uhrbacteria bacterium]